MWKKLARMRSKVALSDESQKDKQSSSSNADASSYYQYPESDAIRLANRAEEADVSSSWTPGEDDELDSTLSHAEVKFPIRSNAIESSPDISYAVITISEAIPSSASLSLFDEEISIGPYILPTYKDAEEQFLDEYEDYFEHLSVDNIRKEQYPKLELQRLVYFDYANFALFSRFQVEQHMRVLLEEGPSLGSVSVSDSSTSNCTTYIHKTQQHILRLLNTNENEYSIIFTSGLTAGFCILGDAYPFQKGSILLVSRDNHESMKHLINIAAHQGARIAVAPVGELDLCMHGPEVYRLLRKKGWNNGSTGLFVYPAQSCLSGVRHSLNWIVEAQQNGWQVLLDASTYLPLGDLDLSLHQPEFVIGSFHHMLGYPSGIGFLLISRKSHSIKRVKASNVLKLIASPAQGKSYHIVSEDNNINLHTFAALSFGLEFLETMCLTAIQKRAKCLAVWLLQTLTSLKHKTNEGQPLLKVYGSRSSKHRGSIVAFNVVDSTGNILPPILIKKLAGKNNIVVGAGDFRNPGLANLLSRSPQKVSDIAMFNTVPDFSAVRVSLGPTSTFQDVYTLVQFLSPFRDENYLSAQAMGFIESSS